MGKKKSKHSRRDNAVRLNERFPEYCTPEHLAGLLGVKKETVERWIREK